MEDENHYKNQYFKLTLRELKNQDSFLISAIDRLHELIGNHQQNSDEILLAIQTAFNAAGMISKLLWKSGDHDKNVDLKNSFRRILTVNNNSELRDRNARNKLEHIDERIAHVSTLPQVQALTLMIVDSTMNIQLEGPQETVQRVYYPDTDEAFIFGRHKNFKKLRREAETLHSALNKIIPLINDKLEYTDISPLENVNSLVQRNSH